MGFLDKIGVGNIVGSAIGAAGSLFGGAISDKRNQAYADQMWQKNYNAQKEFAQNSIQWRVQDAKKAGIHPLYAMGQTPGYTPSDSSYSSAYGEGVSRAMNSIGQAMGQLDLSLKKEQIKGEKLNNANKAVEIANKAVNSTMGQRPIVSSLDSLVGSNGGEIYRRGNGEMYVLPKDMDEILHPGQLRNYLNIAYDKDLHSKIAKKSGGFIRLDPFGYTITPEKNWQTHVSETIKSLFDNVFAEEPRNDTNSKEGVPRMIISK